MSWYAFFVETGKEELIEEYIIRNHPDLHYLIPKRYLTEKKAGILYNVIKLMFPGYIFVRMEDKLNFKSYYKINDFPHLICMLNYSSACLVKEAKKMKKQDSEDYYTKVMKDEEFQNQFFKEVEEDEMEVLLKLLDQNQVVDCSVITAIDGELVVVSGPLVGMEHIIKKIDRRKGKAKINIHVLGEEKYVNVDIVFVA